MQFKKPALEISLALVFLFLTCLSFSANAQWRPASQLGFTQAPALHLNNLYGKKIDIAQYKNKVILVNFWASWCEPCREEFDELIHLQEKFGSKGLVVLAVNLAEMKPRIMQFLKGNGISENSIEIVLDRNSTTYKAWKARGIPTSFLISKTGKIEGVWIGAIENADSSEVQDRIQTLLQQ